MATKFEKFKVALKALFSKDFGALATLVAYILEDKAIPSINKAVFDKASQWAEDVIESIKALRVRYQVETDPVKKKAKLAALKTAVQLADTVADIIAQATEAIKQDLENADE